MQKNFKITINLKTTFCETPEPEFESSQEFNAVVHQLVHTIANSEEILNEFLKGIFCDMLNGAFYSKEIEKKLELKNEAELILNSAQKMDPETSKLLTQLFSNPLNNNLNLLKEDILMSFYSHFGDPKIMDIRFEDLEPGE